MDSARLPGWVKVCSEIACGHKEERQWFFPAIKERERLGGVVLSSTCYDTLSV